MLRALCLSSLAVAALGCTITTYQDPPPRPPPSRGQAAPAQQPPAKKGSRWVSAKNPRPATNTNDPAPRISAPMAFGSGTPAAFRGLAFVLPPDTTKLPNLSGMTPFATLFTDSFNVGSQPFTSGFPGALEGQVDNFALKFEGRFAVPSDGNWQFKLVSDDGAILYVDGAKVVDNDGVHTASTATGQADLKAGPHALRLEYFQAKGPVALQLFMILNGKETLLVGTR